MTKTTFILAFGLILLGGSLLRLWKLGSVPVSLYWDEIAMLADARSIAASGSDMDGNFWLQSIYPSYGDYKLAPYIILSSLFTLLPFPPAVQIRILSVLVGLLTMIVAATLAYQLFPSMKIKQRLQLFLAVMATVAFSPWAIVFSRTGFEGHLAQLFLASSVLFIIIARHRWYWLLMGGLLGALSVSTYYAALYVWPIVGLTAMVSFCWYETAHTVNNTPFWRQLIKDLSIVIVSFIVCIMPLFMSPFFNDLQRIRLGASSVLDPVVFVQQSRETRKIAGNSVFSTILYSAKEYQLNQALTQFFANFSPSFLFLSGDQNLRHSIGYGGLFLLSFLPMLILGIFITLKEHKPAALLLVVWWLVALVPASVPTDVPHALRSLNALVPMSILIGLGWTSLYAQHHKWYRRIFYLLLLLAVIQEIMIAYHYFTTYPKISASAWQDGNHQLVEAVVAKATSVDSVWIDQSDKFFLWYVVYARVPVQTVQDAFGESRFNPKSFGNVHFRPVSSSLSSLNEPILVVGDKSKLQQLAASSAATPSAVINVPSTFGEGELQMAIFGPINTTN